MNEYIKQLGHDKNSRQTKFATEVVQKRGRIKPQVRGELGLLFVNRGGHHVEADVYLEALQPRDRAEVRLQRGGSVERRVIQQHNRVHDSRNSRNRPGRRPKLFGIDNVHN